MAAFKLLNLLALASVAIVTLSSGPAQVNALAADRAHVVRHIRDHGAVARVKRDSSTCVPRPTTSVSSTPTDVPVTTSAPPPPPPPTSSPPPPPPPTTTSSASPSPSPSSTGSKKWGIGWPNGDASYLSNFARPNVQYLYTWSPYLPTGLDQLGIQGIPMLWGWDQVSDFQNLVVKGYANYVLGMNEPNEPSQSNISPSDAANMWKQYIDPLQYQGYYLITPACTNDQAGLDWYQQFFQACSGCHFDGLAFHAYTTDAQSIIDYATQLHNTYNMDIWITEFADQNYSGSGGQATMDEVWSYANTMINFIDNTSWIKGAFPFGVMYDLQGVNQDNSLIDSNGYPSSLGYTYFG